MQKGVNINDSGVPFTDLILAGAKTVETRGSRSLDSVIGKRVGIVRTGCGPATLVGYATIGKPHRYKSRAAFRADYCHHRIPAGSQYDAMAGERWGYPLTDVVAVAHKPVMSRGIVLRSIG